MAILELDQMTFSKKRCEVGQLPSNLTKSNMPPEMPPERKVSIQTGDAELVSTVAAYW